MNFVDTTNGDSLMVSWDGTKQLGYTVAAAPGSAGVANSIDPQDADFGLVVSGANAPSVQGTLMNATGADQIVQLRGAVDEVDINGQLLHNLRNYSPTDVKVPAYTRIETLWINSSIVALWTLSKISDLGFEDVNPTTVQYLRFTFSVAQAGQDLDSFSFTVAVNN